MSGETIFECSAFESPIVSISVLEKILDKYCTMSGVTLRMRDLFLLTNLGTLDNAAFITSSK